MGSAITYDLECPKCKQDTAVSDIYYKNHEEYFQCLNEDCGFAYTYKWKRDEEYKLITRDGTDNHEFDNLIMIETIYEDGKEIVREIKNKNE